MEQISNEIRVTYTDKEIGGVLNGIGEDQRPFTRHFNQSEDFFLLLDGEYTVPHMPIHHDVRLHQPGAEYLAALQQVVDQVARLAPQVLKGLAYFFDPAEILRPCFYRVYHIEESWYLYLLRVDLIMRAAESSVVERGTNDTTPLYKSRRLFLETTVLPLSDVVRQDGTAMAFHISQTISQTWIGEQGRGYFVQGIWMDADLTKFFSKLFLPAGKKIYPFYPYVCKYKTVCQCVIALSPEGRAAAIPGLHRSLKFLAPAMDRIQSEMKGESFSEEMPYFRELKGKVPPAWYEQWQSIRIEAYLNDSEMREFRIEG